MSPEDAPVNSNINRDGTLATTQSDRVFDCSVVRRVSTRTASRSPWTSVDEFAPHLSSSLPGGRSRVRPGRFTVSTSQRRSVLVIAIAVIVSSSSDRRDGEIEIGQAKAASLQNGL